MEMKKVLSLVLSLCLFVSLGAGISFDVAEAAATDLYYDFTVGATANGAAVVSLTSYDAVNDLDTTNKSDNWMYHSASAKGYVQYLYANQGIYLNNGGDRKSNSNVVLQFQVPEGANGKYLPLLDLHERDWSNAAAFTVEVYKLDASGGALTAANLVATKSLYMASYSVKGAMAALADAAIDFAAGDYAINFKIENVGKGSICVDGLKLLAADTIVPATLQVGNNEGLYEVRVGEKIQIPVSAKYTDGTAIDITTSEGWVAPADTAAVHVLLNKENSTLDITGLSEKATPETWNIKLGQAAAYFNVIVRPADYEAPDKNLVYAFGAIRATETSYNSIHLGYADWIFANTTTNAVGKAKNSTATDPWCIYSKKTDTGVENNKLYFSVLYDYATVAFYHAGTVTMGIKVPVDGMYSPKVKNGALAADCTYTLMSADGAKTYATATVPASASNTEYALTAAPVALKAGEYQIVMNKTAHNVMNYIESIKLDYAGGLTYNVTLNAGEGTAPAFTYTHGTAATLPAATKEGYTFDGWYDNAEFTGDAVNAIDEMARGDKVYYAKYTKVPEVFNVSLNANGGNVADVLTSYTEGVGATLPVPTKNGYEFGGWYDNADCIGDAVTAIGTDATGDKTFYAKWTLDVAASDFKVTFDSGYYAYYISNPYREGVIAITATFAKFDTVDIEKAGIMLYVTGNETNESKIVRVETKTLDADTFSALFNGIAKENFGKEALAKAYVVVGDEYIYSEAITTSVDGSRWVGVKPKN